MSPAERDAYMHYVNGGSGDCYQALDRHWPASSRQWARSIVARESRNIPTAANLAARPAAAGSCLSLHGWRFEAGGLRRRSGLTLMWNTLAMPTSTGKRHLAVVAVKAEVASRPSCDRTKGHRDEPVPGRSTSPGRSRPPEQPGPSSTTAGCINAGWCNPPLRCTPIPCPGVRAVTGPGPVGDRTGDRRPTMDDAGKGPRRSRAPRSSQVHRPGCTPLNRPAVRVLCPGLAVTP